MKSYEENKKQWLADQQKGRDELEKILSNATNEELKQYDRNLFNKIQSFAFLGTDPDHPDNRHNNL